MDGIHLLPLASRAYCMVAFCVAVAHPSQGPSDDSVPPLTTAGVPTYNEGFPLSIFSFLPLLLMTPNYPRLGLWDDRYAASRFLCLAEASSQNRRHPARGTETFAVPLRFGRVIDRRQRGLSPLLGAGF